MTGNILNRVFFFILSQNMNRISLNLTRFSLTLAATAAFLGVIFQPVAVTAQTVGLSELPPVFSQAIDICPAPAPDVASWLRLKREKAVKAELVAFQPAESGSTIPEIVFDDLLGKIKSDEPEPDKVVHAVITAYTSTPDQTDDSPFIAASGKRVYDGMIAANWLPFGTKVKIPELYGDKIFTVDDRMNARYGYGRMDIWLDASKTEARKFGVKRLVVEVYYQKKETKQLTLAK